MMVLGRGQYYCVSLCEEKCSIRVSIVLQPEKNPAAEQRIELLQYFQSKIELVMEDFMNASSKPVAYIPCCYCSEFHLQFELLLEREEQHCPKTVQLQPIPEEYYSDLVTDQGLYFIII